MYGEFSFFSLSKEVYKEKGTLMNLRVSEQGLELAGREKTGGRFVASFDSTVPGTLWHRIAIDAELPKDTYIHIYYFASDDRLQWDDAQKDQTGEKLVNCGDALLKNARGRYLWLRIELAGSGRDTPVIRRIRVYYPRMSYLSYLPAVYQQDEASRDFLERFLSLPGTLLTDMEEGIAGIARCFDVDSVPEGYLKWFASWLAISADESWSGDRLRTLLKKGPEIYKRRGTPWAIKEMVRLYTGYTGEHLYLVEYFQVQRMMEVAELKEAVSALYTADPYTFYLLIPQECVDTVQKYLAVQKILDEEKPAFTSARLVVLQPRIYLGMHTYLEVNTRLSEFSGLRLDSPDAVLNFIVLQDAEPGDTNG